MAWITANEPVIVGDNNGYGWIEFAGVALLFDHPSALIGPPIQWHNLLKQPYRYLRDGATLGFDASNADSGQDYCDGLPS